MRGIITGIMKLLQLSEGNEKCSLSWGTLQAGNWGSEDALYWLSESAIWAEFCRIGCIARSRWWQECSGEEPEWGCNRCSTLWRLFFSFCLSKECNLGFETPIKIAKWKICFYLLILVDGTGTIKPQIQQEIKFHLKVIMVITGLRCQPKVSSLYVFTAARHFLS